MWYIRKGLYTKPSSNKFFASFKAWDIYTHLYGTFASYLVITILFFQINWLLLALITSGLGALFELVEYTMEKLFSIKQKASGTELSFISENTPNIIQDIISNTLGAFIGLFYVWAFSG